MSATLVTIYIARSIRWAYRAARMMKYTVRMEERKAPSGTFRLSLRLHRYKSLSVLMAWLLSTNGCSQSVLSAVRLLFLCVIIFLPYCDVSCRVQSWICNFNRKMASYCDVGVKGESIFLDYLTTTVQVQTPYSFEWSVKMLMT
jgi:hypothetical protein